MELLNRSELWKLAIYVLLAIVATGCGTEIPCKDNTNGKALLSGLKKISDYQALSGDIATLANQCTVPVEKIDELSEELSRFVQGAPEELQSAFYKSILYGDAAVKSKFIKLSPIFQTAKRSEKFNVLEEFTMLGTGVSSAKLSTNEKENIKKFQIDDADAANADGRYRVVATGIAAEKMLLEIFHEAGAHGDSTSLFMYNPVTGEKPLANHDIQHMNASFGTGYSSKTTYFIVDESGSLRYLYSFGKHAAPGGEDENGEAKLTDCFLSSVFHEISGKGAKLIVNNRDDSLGCSNFENFNIEAPSQNILSYLSKIAGTKNNADYVNFEIKDVADNEIVDLALKQGEQAMLHLINKVQKGIPHRISFEGANFQNPENIAKVLNAVTGSVENVDWLLKGRVSNDLYNKFTASFSQIRADVKRLDDERIKIESMRNKISAAKDKAEKYKRMYVYLLRELTFEDDGFTPSRGQEYGYLARVSSYGNLALIYSERSLFNGNPSISVAAEEYKEKIKWRVNGFTSEISQYEAAGADILEYFDLAAEIKDREKRFKSDLLSLEGKLKEKFADLVNIRAGIARSSSS